MKKVTVYLDEQLWRTFRVVCLEEGISASQKITQWITHYVQQQSDDKITHKQP